MKDSKITHSFKVTSDDSGMTNFLKEWAKNLFSSDEPESKLGPPAKEETEKFAAVDAKADVKSDDEKFTDYVGALANLPIVVEAPKFMSGVYRKDPPPKEKNKFGE